MPGKPASPMLPGLPFSPGYPMFPCGRTMSTGRTGTMTPGMPFRPGGPEWKKETQEKKGSIENESFYFQKIDSKIVHV